MSQDYFPVAVIDNQNKLQLIKYNKGIRPDERVSSEKLPGYSKFQVMNLKNPIDELGLSRNILDALFLSKRPTCTVELTISGYDGTSAQVEFQYTGCTPAEFVSALLECPILEIFSEKGVNDWVPLDTQSLILLYPDYHKETPKPTENTLIPSSSTGNVLISSSSTVDEPSTVIEGQLADTTASSHLSSFDWRYAHFEESFRSFASKDQTRFNIRKEGVIVVSVIRDWLVSEKLHDFTQNLLLFTNLVSSSGHSQTKLVFWILARFKQIVDGFQTANQLYDRLAQYRTHFQNVFTDHHTQMDAHLKALQDHIEAILDDNHTASLQERIIRLAELLVLSTKTMLSFTVALQTRLKELGSIRESTHRKLLTNAVMAAAGIGMAFYTRSTSKMITRAAQLTTVAGGCSLVYYYHQFTRELDALVTEQTIIIDQAAHLTLSLQQHTNLWAHHATASDSDFTAMQPIIFNNLATLQADLQQLRTSVTVISAPPTSDAASKSITWWRK